MQTADHAPFVFVGERLWLDFVNTDDVRRGVRVDALRDFSTFAYWLEAAGVLDSERGAGIRRRAHQQPAGATAALVDSRRVRAALRTLAEHGIDGDGARAAALNEINRILGRSAGTRRVEARADGTFVRTFVPVGDAFAGLIIPIVDTAADALILGELPRVRRCADGRCARVFYDSTKNGRRRWCDMATCGNRAKAARFRERRATRTPPNGLPIPDVPVEIETVSRRTILADEATLDPRRDAGCLALEGSRQTLDAVLTPLSSAP